MGLKMEEVGFGEFWDEQVVKRPVRERMLGVGLNDSDFWATFGMIGWYVHPRSMSRGACGRIIFGIGSLGEYNSFLQTQLLSSLISFRFLAHYN